MPGTFSLQQLKALLTMQNHLNEVVNPDWLKASYKWNTAVLVEAVEAIDYIGSECGYPWWKVREAKVPELTLELIDMLHFVLSSFYEIVEGDLDAAWERYDQVILNPLEPDEYTVLSALEEMCSTSVIANVVINDKDDNITDLVDFTLHQLNLLHLLFDMYDISMETVFTTYTGKYALNLFRQANGYKQGTYHREWDGKNDNDHLSDITEGLSQDELNNVEQLVITITALLDISYKSGTAELSSIE